MIHEAFNPDGVGVDNGNYFCMPFTPEEAELVLLSAPWDVTVSYGAGTAYAPDAIIGASTQLDFYDPAAPDAWRHGIATAPVDYNLLERSEKLRIDARRVIEHLEQGGETTDDYVVRKIRRVNEGSFEMNSSIREQAEQWLEQGKLVGLVGGDHSTPYGLIRALGKYHPSFGILHIDAHCDLREKYEGFIFSHASIMYNVLHDVQAVERIVQVGIRDFSAAERQLAEESGRVVQFDDQQLLEAEMAGENWDAMCRKIIDALPEQVYVSFDIDGLDLCYCPHTGTPVPGGLKFNQAVRLLQLLGAERRIIGFDLVEVSPHASDNIDASVGARMLWKLCGQTLRSNHK
ncbi:MAG: agmatinase family protein [Rikenellaceae bacterium]|nr:agmatinase family protein [Rikenellaceae bacterium]